MRALFLILALFTSMNFAQAQSWSPERLAVFINQINSAILRFDSSSGVSLLEAKEDLALLNSNWRAGDFVNHPERLPVDRKSVEALQLLSALFYQRVGAVTLHDNTPSDTAQLVINGCLEYFPRAYADGDEITRVGILNFFARFQATDRPSAFFYIHYPNASLVNMLLAAANNSEDGVRYDVTATREQALKILLKLNGHVIHMQQFSSRDGAARANELALEYVKIFDSLYTIGTRDYEVRSIRGLAFGILENFWAQWIATTSAIDRGAETGGWRSYLEIAASRALAEIARRYPAYAHAYEYNLRQRLNQPLPRGAQTRKKIEANILSARADLANYLTGPGCFLLLAN